MLSFSDDGSLISVGSEMSYYNSIRFFRVDSTAQNGLALTLFISTNRANIPFRQGVEFRRDTLVLKPQNLGGAWSNDSYLKFLRAR
jgi:hypothetical protein